MLNKIRSLLAGKASAVGPLITLHSTGRAIWTPRNYAALAREGYAGNVVGHRCVSMLADAASAVPLVTSLVGGLMSGPVNKILDAYIADTELRRRLEADLKGRLVEHLAREEALQQSVIVAEIASESWLTRSWRPLMMTGIFAFLAFVGLILPLADIVVGHPLPFNPRWSLFPPELWQFLSIGVGGYVGGRSLEKIAAAVAPAAVRSRPGAGSGKHS